MPPNQARSNIHAANPQAEEFLALLAVLPTSCKYNTVYWVLSTGCKHLGGSIASDRFLNWAPVNGLCCTTCEM